MSFGNFHNNATRGLASSLIDELYQVAKADPKIMVINWLAFAYELICKESAILNSSYCQSIEDFFIGLDKFGVNEIEKLIINKFELEVLHAWHELHYLKSHLPDFEDEYSSYIQMTHLNLPNFTLG